MRSAWTALAAVLLRSFSLPAVAQHASPSPSAEVPCGTVTFTPVGPPRYDAERNASEQIRALVLYADGHTESASFPYPWLYPDGERNDPWSSTNLRSPSNLRVTVQFPPPG